MILKGSWCHRADYEKIDPIYLSFPPLAALPVTSTVKPQWQLWPRLHVIFQPSSVVRPLGLNVDPGRSCRDCFYWGKFSQSVMGTLVRDRKTPFLVERPGSDILRIDSWNLFVSSDLTMESGIPGNCPKSQNVFAEVLGEISLVNKEPE